jgi:hypothetical protein
MTTGEGGIGWAHSRALLGDEAFLLAGCSMPIILRKDCRDRVIRWSDMRTLMTLWIMNYGIPWTGLSLSMLRLGHGTSGGANVFGNF